MNFREITPADDSILANIIRKNLKSHALDIPGTAYYDNNLDHLSEYYLNDNTNKFYLIAEEDGCTVGGVGLSECLLFDNCSELQKLYLADSAKGKGTGYTLIKMIEDKARLLGYTKMYLETHDNLPAAIHLYKKCGYKEIAKPDSIVHATMNRFFIKDL